LDELREAEPPLNVAVLLPPERGPTAPRSAIMGFVSDLVVAILGFAGGIIVAGLGAWQAAQAAKLNLRGRARLVHEDLRRLQSMVGRLYYGTEREGEWGEKAWLGEPLSDSDDQQDVVAHLKGENFEDCANALGWAAYFRRVYTDTPTGLAHTDEELEERYLQFARGRRALIGLAKLPFRDHDAKQIVGPNVKRNGDRTLSNK
jgi:hypothetical protein